MKRALKCLCHFVARGSIIGARDQTPTQPTITTIQPIIIILIIIIVIIITIIVIIIIVIATITTIQPIIIIIVIIVMIMIIIRALPSGVLLLLFFALISIGALPFVRSTGYFEVTPSSTTIDN